MSADAKVWQDGEFWRGVHDGTCDPAAGEHHDLSLSAVIESMETCMRYRLAWSIREHGNGPGLIGYETGGTPKR